MGLLIETGSWNNYWIVLVCPHYMKHPCKYFNVHFTRDYHTKIGHTQIELFFIKISIFGRTDSVTSAKIGSFYINYKDTCKTVAWWTFFYLQISLNNMCLRSVMKEIHIINIICEPKWYVNHITTFQSYSCSYFFWRAVSIITDASVSLLFLVFFLIIIPMRFTDFLVL